MELCHNAVMNCLESTLYKQKEKIAMIQSVGKSRNYHFSSDHEDGIYHIIQMCHQNI